MFDLLYELKEMYSRLDETQSSNEVSHVPHFEMVIFL